MEMYVSVHSNIAFDSISLELHWTMKAFTSLVDLVISLKFVCLDGKHGTTTFYNFILALKESLFILLNT